ncbi:MAG TPA: hypothetical protein DC064_24915 [Cyanobacteria bacterium UBA9273]|nr:hypothetical protein [Cyanobacteria bacterium UBA9273]
MRTEFIGSPWMRFSLKVNQIPGGAGESIEVIAFTFDIFTATRPYSYIFYIYKVFTYQIKMLYSVNGALAPA